MIKYLFDTAFNSLFLARFFFGKTEISNDYKALLVVSFLFCGGKVLPKVHSKSIHFGAPSQSKPSAFFFSIFLPKHHKIGKPTLVFQIFMPRIALPEL